MFGFSSRFSRERNHQRDASPYLLVCSHPPIAPITLAISFLLGCIPHSTQCFLLLACSLCLFPSECPFCLVCLLFSLFVCLFVGLSVCWFVCLFACSFVGLFVCLFDCLLTGWFECFLFVVFLFVCSFVGLFAGYYFACLFIYFVCLFVRRCFYWMLGFVHHLNPTCTASSFCWLDFHVASLVNITRPVNFRSCKYKKQM